MTAIFQLSATPIDVAALAADVADNRAGAFVSFEGRVRDHNDGKAVERLDYEVFHALAQTEGEKILREAIAQFGLYHAHAIHREGALLLGDCAVWVGVTAAHRGEAFAACRYIIDGLKHKLPIWKKEYYRDGSAEWVNCQHHDTHIDCDHDHAATGAVAPAQFYARQMRLPEIGIEGQKKLGAARVLVVGAGGLGAAASLCLSLAGVGTLGLVEHDNVDVSNLHRQILYSTVDIGQKKVLRAAETLRRHNPLIEIITHDEKLTSANAECLFNAYDLVLDCTDNFASKYVLNDAAILFEKPLIQASVYRFEGQMLVIDGTTGGGCLRCLWPAAPAEGLVGDCAEVGVLGTLPVTFGSFQAQEAINHILGIGSSLSQELLTFDMVTFESRKIKRQRNSACAACGDNPSITELKPASASALEWSSSPDASLATLSEQFALIDVREDSEQALAPIKGAERMPLSGFRLDAVPFPRATPLLILCASGGRSLSATERLREAGWTEAYSLKGGLKTLLMDNANG